MLKNESNGVIVAVGFEGYFGRICRLGDVVSEVYKYFRCGSPVREADRSRFLRLLQIQRLINNVK